MRNLCSLSILATICGLIGCAGTPMTYDPSYAGIKLDGYYSDGLGGRDVRLVVNGNPFGQAGNAFAQQVEANLQDVQPTGREPTHPKLAPGPSAKTFYSLVWVFDPPPYLVDNAVCSSGPKVQTAPAQGSTVVAVAAFCLEDRALSEIFGRTDASGPADERVKFLEERMMVALLRPDAREPGPPNPGVIKVP